ncbi:hypothetical protein BDM02DRAFT_3124076, partial [Thelephora ganbajun]
VRISPATAKHKGQQATVPTFLLPTQYASPDLQTTLSLCPTPTLMTTKGTSGPSPRRRPQYLDQARVPARPLHAMGRSLTFLPIGEPAGQQHVYSSRLACSNSVPWLQGI